MVKLAIQRLHIRIALRKHESSERLGEYAKRIGGRRETFLAFCDLLTETYIKKTDAQHTITADGVILDRIFDFIKWLYESGMLEWLIGLFGGLETFHHQVNELNGKSLIDSIEEECNEDANSNMLGFGFHFLPVADKD
jgi:hypothetical protein